MILCQHCVHVKYYVSLRTPLKTSTRVKLAMIDLVHYGFTVLGEDKRFITIPYHNTHTIEL